MVKPHHLTAALTQGLVISVNLQGPPGKGHWRLETTVDPTVVETFIADPQEFTKIVERLKEQLHAALPSDWREAKLRPDVRCAPVGSPLADWLIGDRSGPYPTCDELAAYDAIIMEKQRIEREQIAAFDAKRQLLAGI